MSSDVHLPVMVREVVSLLGPSLPGMIGDLTVGAGGHAKALLEASGPRGRLFGMDRDPKAAALAEARLAGFGDRVTIVRDRFSKVRERMGEFGVPGFDALLLDLGLSSFQLEDPERGFSFQSPGPLDMRMDPEAETTAADLVNTLSREDLESLIREYGEERFAGRIARALIEKRPFFDTLKLARAVADAVPGRKGRIHPATRVFQALRIMVNRELEELGYLLGLLPEILNPGGRAALISFHSLEDRLVKDSFRRLAQPGNKEGPGFSILTKKVLRPKKDEVKTNPRARSARLRGLARAG